MSNQVGIHWPTIPLGMWGQIDENAEWKVFYQVGTITSRDDLYQEEPYWMWDFTSLTEAMAFEWGLENAAGLDDFNWTNEEVESHLTTLLDRVPRPEELEAYFEGVEQGEGWIEVESVLVDPTSNFLLQISWSNARRILRRLLGRIPREILEDHPYDLPSVEELITYVNLAAINQAELIWNVSPAVASEIAVEETFQRQLSAYVKSLAAGLKREHF